jgi:serine/threonine protein kinase
MHYGDMYNSNRPENVEILMIKLLSEFVIKKQTPHIILPITTFNTSIKPFLDLDIIKNRNEKNDKNYIKFLQRYKKGDYYNNVSVLVSEWANNGDLLDYMRNNYKKIKLNEWKIIFFQLLSVLAVIQNKYPSFRHNDLKANNILVTETNPRNYIYGINKQTYILLNTNITLLLWDFDFSCIKGLIENSKVNIKWANDLNINSTQNKYYDIHYFFNTLTKKGFFPEIMTKDIIPIEVKEFINRVVPYQYRTGENVSDRGRLMSNDEYTTPDKILRNDVFFENFRKSIKHQ